MADQPSSTAVYYPVWAISGGVDGAECCAEFKLIARRGMVALGTRCADPDNAVDEWLLRVYAYRKSKESEGAHRSGWKLKSIVGASKEYCGELATSSYEAGDLNSQHTFDHLRGEFNTLLENGGEYLWALWLCDHKEPTEVEWKPPTSICARRTPEPGHWAADQIGATEPSDGAPICAEASRAGNGTDRRAAVDDFISRCNREVPFNAKRNHIWRAAGHRAARQFQFWQARDPKATAQDDANFRRILAMTPTDFQALLEKKGLLSH